MRRGVTLIELLIVVTIIAILSGAAIPYVQQYIDDSRISKAKADLDEIRNALVRYELERGQEYTGTTIASLVGPFLSKALVDPWGAPYQILTASSTCFTKGSDGQIGGGDDIIAEFRPRMAVSRIVWLDINQNGTVDIPDSVLFKCTRPILTAAPNLSGLTLSGGSLSSPAQVTGTFKNIASYAVLTAFVPGSDTVSIAAGNQLQDGTGASANSDKLKILAQ